MQNDLRSNLVNIPAGLPRLASACLQGAIRRHELPKLCALQFVCDGALAGGVTTSLALDAHGKALSYALLEIEI